MKTDEEYSGSREGTRSDLGKPVKKKFIYRKGDEEDLIWPLVRWTQM